MWILCLCFGYVYAESRYIPRAQAPRLLTSAPGSISVLLPTAPVNSSYVELHVRDCPGESTEFYKLTVQVGDSPFTMSALQPDSVCIFRARGVKTLADQEIEDQVGPWSFFIPFRAATAPSWATQELTMTQIGDNTVRVSWPQPDIGGSALTGYLLAMSGTQEGEYRTLYDGRDLATVQEFLITNLEYTTTYFYRLYAYNKLGPTNPPLAGVYTIGSSVTADRSVISPWDVEKLASLKAGEPVSLTVNAVHPRTGLAEYLGGGCTIAEDPNCVPGRMFACWLQDVCEINAERSECARKRVTVETAAGVSYVPGTLLPVGYTPFVSSDLNNGSHVLSFTPMRRGEYSLVVQAFWGKGLLANLYDNPLFHGTPVDTKSDALIDHDWGTDAVTRYSSDYVSVRWTGFIEVENKDVFTFYCQADDYCRVYLNTELIIDAFDDERCCGEFYSPQVELSPDFYYPFKVEYVERSETAKISVLWSSVFYQPKEVIQNRFLYRGSYLAQTPFAVTVNTGEYDPSQSEIFGENLFMASTKGMNEFYVQIKDKGGNIYDKYAPGYFLVKANFEQLDAEGNAFSILANILDADLHDGVYLLRYSTAVVGDYRVRVTVGGVEVKNSPIVISVN